MFMAKLLLLLKKSPIMNKKVLYALRKVLFVYGLRLGACTPSLFSF
ncbi:hypothetical protein SBF1_4300001 [Candidatus Desulfosporosinus infrequens]|uniref:Uncharacterized protein n=1 Tax=Candidatus Desulfosporosinus infrequens TaxID=2043169 RepID=A0A2U3LB16_9FIRM|nr:hypothetical protein SBF1_4300001 [Candidatus Desulfosporosinus infrequens]